MQKYKKNLAILLTVFIWVTCFADIALVMGNSGSERLIFNNQYMAFSVNTKNGRFASRTNDGDPWRNTDTDKPVLYEKDIPETSYTSFNIEGEEVIFGNSYGNLIEDYGYFLQEPEAGVNSSTAVWKYRNLEITQTIELIETSGDISVGNARITYTVENKSTKSVKMGTRILLDIMTGDNDGPVILKPGDEVPVLGERVFEGDMIPLFWNTVDDLAHPSVSSYGTLYGWGEAKPTKVIFGNWYGLSSTKWDYDYDPWMEYATANNKYGAADSAVGIYWEDQNIPAGSVRSFSTTLGMGNLEDRKYSSAGQLVVNVSAPKKVLIDEENPVPFEVSAVLDNSFNSSMDFTNIEVEISYPDNLILEDGDKKQIIPILKQNETELIGWKFKPTQLEDVNVYDFVVSVKRGQRTQKFKVYSVVMPSFTEMPNMQYSYIAPQKLYHEEKYRVIEIKGDNFNYFKDDPEEWDVYLKDAGGNEYVIGDQFVNVQSDSTIYATVPTHFKIDGSDTFLGPGFYGLGIRHNLIDGFYRANAIEVTDNAAYMRRGYGTLLFTSKDEIVYGFDGEPITLIKNRIHHFKGKQTPVVPEGEREIMRVAGDIQKVDDTDLGPVYSVIPQDSGNPVYLGDGILRIIGETDNDTGKTAEMLIMTLSEEVFDSTFEKKGEHRKVKIFGNDRCRIYLNTESAIGGLINKDTLIWTKAFDLDINNMELKNIRMFGLSEEIMAVLGAFSLGVQKFKVYFAEEKGQYTVDFTGMLDLMSVLEQFYTYFGDSCDGKLAYLDIQIDSFRVYKDGTIDFRIDTGIGLPTFTLQHFNPLENPEDMKGIVTGRLKIDTIDGLYSIYVQLGVPSFQELGGDLDETTASASVSGKFGVFTFATPIGPMLMLDTVEVEIDTSMGFIQLGNLPFAINQLGGGIYNLHTIRDAINKGEVPDFSGDFWFGINDTFSPLILGKRMINAKNCKISVGNRRIRFSGDTSFYMIPLTNSGFTIYSYPVIGADVWGELKFLDVIIAYADAELTYDFEKGRFYAGGSLRGTLQVPRYIPFFGGYKFVDLGGTLNTDNAMVFFYIGKTRYGAKYTWSNQSLEYGGKTYEQEIGNKSTGLLKNGIYAMEEIAEDGTKKQLIIGSNVFAIPTSTKESRMILPGVLASSGEMTLLGLPEVNGFFTEFESQGAGALLVQGRYPMGQDVLSMEIFKPDGSSYELIPEGDEQNIFIAECENADTGAPEMGILIDIPEEANRVGKWEIISPIDVKFNVAGVKTAPEIRNISITDEENGQLTALVEFTGEVFSETDSLDLFIINEEQGKETAICIMQNQPVSGFSISHNFELPEALPTGSKYKIAAVLNHYDTEGGEKNLILSDRKESDFFEVRNEKTPESPQNVVTTEMNSRVKVEWDAVGGQEITGYLVTAINEHGTTEEGASSIFVPYKEGKTRYEAFIEGWTYDKEYNIVVQAFLKEEAEGNEEEEIIGYSNVSELLGSGRYQVEWEQDENADEYKIVLFDESGQIAQSFFYEVPEGIPEAGMINVVVRGLPPKVKYSVKVYPVPNEDLKAKNVTVTTIGDGSSKTICFDSVQSDNLKSYMIVAAPRGDSGQDKDLVLYEYTITEEHQPESYEITIPGFDPEKIYDVSVVANKNVSEPSKVYYGELSAPKRVLISTPNPPDFSIVLQPDQNTKEGSIIQKVFEENGITGYVTNTT